MFGLENLIAMLTKRTVRAEIQWTKAEGEGEDKETFSTVIEGITYTLSYPKKVLKIHLKAEKGRGTTFSIKSETADILIGVIKEKPEIKQLCNTLIKWNQTPV